MSHDGGNTWTAPVQISGPVNFFTVPAVAADGSVYVKFWSFDNEVAPQFRDHYAVVKVDPATGQALGAPAEVGLIYDGINDCPVAFGSRTYQDSVFRTWPTGNITADPTNARHLAVVWSDMRSNPYPGALLPSLDPYQVQTNSDIIVSQSFDGGAHWSVPTAIMTIMTPNDQFMPWGAYDATGRLQIGYDDRSYDLANHKYGYTLASETAPGTLNVTLQQVTSTPDADIDTPEAWNITTGSRDYLVAVIDSGVDYNHPDLVANMWTNPFETPGDGIDNDGAGCWRGCLRSMGRRSFCAATTGRSLWRRPCTRGWRRAGRRRCILSRAVRGRTRMGRASTGSFATSA